jgi:phosphotriesterase-related protein
MSVQNPILRKFSRRDLIRVLGAGAGLGAARALPWNAEELAAAQNVFTSVQAVKVPKGAVIRTLVKDVSPDAFARGATLVHEHVSGDVELMVEELKAAHEDGLGALVALTTDRRPDEQVERIKQVAARSPVQIVLGGGYLEDLGFHKYPANVAAMSESQLVEELVGDATRQRWGAFGEIGTSLELQPDERKMLRAIGQASARTGLPILTHVPHEGCPKCALEQLEVFLSQGAKPENIAIGHLATIQSSQDPTMETHKTIAKRGAFIDFGPLGHEMARSHVPEAEKVKRFMMLMDAGLEDRVMLSSDLGNYNHLKTNWGLGFSSVLLQFVPKLRRAGVKETLIRKVLVDNPRRFLAFVPKST